MKPSEAIKPISYLKTHASKIIRDITDNQKSLVITQNGKAKVVLQDIRTYEETQESLALLKILAVSSKNLKERKYKPVKEALKNLSNKIEKL